MGMYQMTRDAACRLRGASCVAPRRSRNRSRTAGEGGRLKRLDADLLSAAWSHTQLTKGAETR